MLAVVLWEAVAVVAVLAVMAVLLAAAEGGRPGTDLSERGGCCRG